MSLDVARLPAVVACLRPFVDAGIIGPTEVHLSALVLDSFDLDDAHLAHAVAAAAWAMLHGHDCADVRRLPAVVQQEVRRQQADSEAPALEVSWPDPDEWLTRLRSLAASSPAPVRVTSGPDLSPVLDERPLVLDGDRLYLQRLWFDECVVATGLLERAAATPRVPDAETVGILEVLLPYLDDDGEPDMQRAAAEVILRTDIAVVVGGPGTGKTYSVARVLAALHHQAHQRHERLLVALAAPTGKAAQRLAETVANAVRHLHGVVADDTIATLTSIEPTTIHRLLGSYGTTGRFRHGAAAPLDHDVVIVDETSMVSLPLAARLVESLRPDARLVLVGDPDQLVSVEIGAMLADIVQASSEGPLAGRVVRLDKSHRFAGRSPIGVLARHIQAGDGHRASAMMYDAPRHDLHDDRGGSTVRVVPTGAATDGDAVAAVRSMVEPTLRIMREDAERGDAAAALDALGRSRILCAHRRGPAGVSTWNRLAEEWMRGSQSGRGAWYPGRPILVTKTDQRLDLSNGDTGVVVRRGDLLEIVFPRASGAPVAFPTFALADVDTCFAMTVHKSQGSEYESVVLILPPAGSPLIGREMAYTGITRARRHLLLIGSPTVLADCADSPAERMTGLQQALGVR